jgi:hypothetical protein
MFSFIKTLLDRPGISHRRHQRVACEQVAELAFPDKRISLHGMVIEASHGGALFREASRFILDRRDENVILKATGLEIPGTIVNVRDVGYGILFNQEIDEDTIARLVDGRDLKAA